MTGRTTTITAPTSAAMVSSGRLGTKVFGLSSSHRSDANASAATVELRSGEEPQRVADPRPDQVEDDGPEGDPDQEDAEDHREHVGRVAGARTPAGAST